MKRFCKILAVVLATVMLVTMATACKKADDDINSVLNNGGTTLNNNNSDAQDNGTTDNGTTDNNAANGDTNNGTTDNGTTNNGSTNNGGDNATQQEIVENFDATKKYDFASNPLLAESKPINTGVEPSFDLDTTGFIKNNIKIKDLKGKTLTMITALERANFVYNGPNGEELNEWTWFDAMKKTYGLNFKYIESRFDKAPQQIITYMNAGKALDLYTTHRAGFPQFLLISAPLDPYLNLQYVDNSPGVDKRTMEQMKWDGTYRCIAPIGAVDVLWYNETMAKSFGLQDPHTLWEQGKWTWETYQDFAIGAPKQSSDGSYSLTVGWCSEGDAVLFYPRTNGINVFDIKTTNGKSTIVSNFKDQRCLDAWEFISGIGKGRNSVYSRPSGDPQDDMYELGTTLMQGTTYLMRDYSGYEYAKTQKYNWVPYPGSTAENCMCMNYGNTMMLPKKTKNQANIPYAVKFMELWANRFTEAINDNLQKSYYGFDYQDRVQYFDFAAKTNFFGIGTKVFNSLTGSELEYYKQFTWAFYNPNYNITTTATQLYNLVDKAVAEMMEYGA